MDVFLGALRVLVYGITGVFLVLALFYIIIKAMLKLFPDD